MAKVGVSKVSFSLCFEFIRSYGVNGDLIQTFFFFYEKIILGAIGKTSISENETLSVHLKRKYDN